MMEMARGLLPLQLIRHLVDEGAVSAEEPFSEGQIQPASLDLRLGPRAYRIRASFLTGEDCRVEDRLPDFSMHEIDLADGAVLEKGCVYLLPLMERVALPEGITAVSNAKSSTGRLDLLTRLVTDRGTEFDRIPAGYGGPLYAEV